MARSVIALLGLSAALAAACSDDTYIATNEPMGGSGGAAAGGAESGGGSSTGGAGAQSTGGSAGSTAGQGGASGTDGAAGSPATGGTGGGGVCTPGKTEDLGTCEKCGTSRRTCSADGQWGSPVCEGQGDCKPGDKTGTGCDDPCADKTCDQSCHWGGCQKKSGAVCLYEKGTNWQCCGTDKWQFCNDSTCDWYPCQACQAGSSCLNVC